MKTVISLSGGMDSTTVLGHCVAKGDDVFPVQFMYGSKHNFFERNAVAQILKHYKLSHRFIMIDISGVFEHVNSNLLSSGGAIPEGHYNDETMRLTVVPGRNLTFISILAAYAEGIGAGRIALGIHQGDHHIYPDCRREFFESAAATVMLSTDGKVTLYAPFLSGDKADILRAGVTIDVPYQYTRTCYKAQPISCGKCGACRERLEAWQKIEKKDPILYTRQ